MISIRIYGAAVRIHFSFLVFNALIFLMRSCGLVLSFYAVCLLHEAGHLIALRHTGGSISTVDISGAGIVIGTRKDGSISDKSRLFVLLAGPAANILLYVLLSICGYHRSLAQLNLIAAVYNMLPYRSLDGGAIISLLSVGTVRERAVMHILTAVKLLMIALSAAAVHYCGREVFPLLAASLALFIGDIISLR